MLTLRAAFALAVWHELVWLAWRVNYRWKTVLCNTARLHGSAFASLWGRKTEAIVSSSTNASWMLSFPIPLVMDILDNVYGCKFLFTLNMKSGFYQVSFEESSKSFRVGNSIYDMPNWNWMLRDVSLLKVCSTRTLSFSGRNQAWSCKGHPSKPKKTSKLSKRSKKAVLSITSPSCNPCTT